MKKPPPRTSPRHLLPTRGANPALERVGSCNSAAAASRMCACRMSAVADATCALVFVGQIQIRACKKHGERTERTAPRRHHHRGTADLVGLA